MTPRPQLRLTEHDINAGVAAFHQALPKYGNPGLTRTAAERNAVAGHIVTAIVSAINEQRGGDPLGTVRRSTNGTYAIRVREDGGVYCWRLVHPNGEVTVSDGDLSQWTHIPGPGPGA